MTITKLPAINLKNVPAGLKNRTNLLQELAEKNNFSKVFISRIDAKRTFFKPTDIYTVVAFSDKSNRLALGRDVFFIEKKTAKPSTLFEQICKSFEKASEIINNKLSKWDN